MFMFLHRSKDLTTFAPCFFCCNRIYIECTYAYNCVKSDVQFHEAGSFTKHKVTILSPQLCTLLMISFISKCRHMSSLRTLFKRIMKQFHTNQKNSKMCLHESKEKECSAYGSKVIFIPSLLLLCCFSFRKLPFCK